MKKFAPLIAVAVLAACGQTDSPDEDQATALDLDSSGKTASYALGYRYGGQLKEQLAELDTAAFVAGLGEGIKGEAGNPLLTNDQMDEALNAYQQEMMAKAQAEAAAAGEENRAAGDKFRAENAEREGVVTLESGVQYEVLESGDGEVNPTLEDEVKAHYHGTLVDGTVFDSSVDRDQPATFPLGHVIPGWQEAVSKMVVGDKWRVVIPPDQAYGDQGSGGAIAPGSTLVFEVELLEINP